MEISENDIFKGLRELGLKSGDKVLAHSALSSFGYVRGGAAAVIGAMLSAVCSEGTIMVPTLTGDESLSPNNPPVFDPQETACWTGRIPETFRKMPEAVRSLHPTHSVAAIGPDANILLNDHVDSLTPCDERSPYGKLGRLKDGYVLLIGVDLNSCTLLHYVEELAGVNYHLQTQPARATIRLETEVIHRSIFLHQYGTKRNFPAIEPLLIERGIQQHSRIGSAQVRLIQAVDFVDLAYACLRIDPLFLIEKRR